MKYTLLFLIAILSSCASTNTKDSAPSVFGDDHPLTGMPSEPGKCYAKCMLENDVYETSIEEFIEYTGDSENENVEISELVISPASSKWEKIRADENCLSEDPNDCLVWCLVEVPAQYLTILKDTAQSSNWKITEVEVKELVKEGGFTEWTEVVCNGDVTPQLYRDIKNSLYELGIYKGARRDDDSWRKEAKIALMKFQRDNGLPIGNLNIPTMNALGVEY